MTYAIKYKTDLSKALVKLSRSLDLTGIEWITEDIPERVFAISSNRHVIADWKSIWEESPIVSKEDMPILMGLKPLTAQSEHEVAQYVVKSIRYWSSSPDKTRYFVEAKANATHQALHHRNRELETRKARRQAARSSAISAFVPLPEMTVNAVKAQFDFDDRFRNDNRKVLTNVLRNTGNGTSSGIHFLFPHFRGRKVAAICTTQDETSIHTLKQWQAAGVNARHLISDLPFPTDKLQSVYDLYHKLADGLDAFTK